MEVLLSLAVPVSCAGSIFFSSQSYSMQPPRKGGHMQVTLIRSPSHHTALGFAPGVLLCYPIPVSWSDAG